MSGGLIRHPQLDCDAFDRDHPGWPRRVPGEPLYSLPEKMISRLGQPGQGRPPVLDGPAVEAERHLLTLCRRHHAVGYFGRNPIDYPHLTPPLPPPARGDVLDLEWSGAQWLGVERGLRKTNQANLRLGGYAGWLATEPPFLAAVTDLATRWRALPAAIRPDFPLRRPTPLPRAHEGLSPAPEPVYAFAADFHSFCDRWGLMAMATWDLPLPQGPLLPSPLPPGSPALPANAVYLAVPAHYPLAGDDDLLRLVRAQQQALADRLGLGRGCAGLPHHKFYGRVLEVVHLELAITGRYPGNRRPRGFVGVMVEAVAEALGLSVDRVRGLRKVIAACRHGCRPDLDKVRSRDP